MRGVGRGRDGPAPTVSDRPARSVPQSHRAGTDSQGTTVVVIPDHGDMHGERGMWFKRRFFDHPVRVPPIIHAPQRFVASRRRENVSLVDRCPRRGDGVASRWFSREPLDAAERNLTRVGRAATFRRFLPDMDGTKNET